MIDDTLFLKETILDLTTALLLPYVGGQMEFQNPNEGYLFRGEIEDVSVKEGEMRVKFKWIAQGVGYPPLPTGWENDPELDYVISTILCSAQRNGSSGDKTGVGGRILINAPRVGEIIVLFPPGERGLDPAEVRGLELAGE